jgi:heat shock protein HtpX
MGDGGFPLVHILGHGPPVEPFASPGVRMNGRQDFYAAQARNRRLTWLLIGGFVLLLGLIGLAADMFVFGSFWPGESGFPFVSALAAGVASFQSYSAYMWGDRAVLNSLHAWRLVAPDTAEEHELDNVVTEMAIAAGLPKPKVYVINDPAPNAFATGRNPENASIGVTRGLLDLLDREETQGVIAHEMSHIRNYDTRTMTLVAAMLGTLLLISDWSLRALRAGFDRRGRDDRKGGAGGTLLALIAIVFIVLAPVLSRLLAMAVSRQREYLADASGVELTRNPAGLARALERIRGSSSPLKRATQGTAHLFISDPLERRLDDRESFFAELFSTHPPLEKRIDRLRRMGYLAGPAAVPGGASPSLP